MERNNNELPSSFNYHFSFNNKTTYALKYKFSIRGLTKRTPYQLLRRCSNKPNWTEEHLTGKS